MFKLARIKTPLVFLAFFIIVILVAVFQSNHYHKKISLLEGKIDDFKNNSTDSNHQKKAKEIHDLLTDAPVFFADYDSPDYKEKKILISKKIYVSQNDLNNLSFDTKNWLHPNGNYDQTRHYKNSQINTANVHNLKLAVTFKTDVLASIESAPIVVNGVMYVSTAFNNIYAFNAKTGELFWHYKYINEKGNYYRYNCCGPNNRGLAIIDNQIFMGTLDAHIISVNAITGDLIWKSSIVGPYKDGYSATAAPIVVDNKVIIGVGDGEWPIRGRIKAFDRFTGKEIWTFYTIPEKGQEGIWASKDATGHDLHRDIENEKKVLANKKSLSIKSDESLDMGGGVWMSPSVDLKTKTLFFVAGNPFPNPSKNDMKGYRPGDNLYTNSIIAIDLNTGKYKWHFQYIPHDIWDLDSASPTIIANLFDKNQEKLPVVMHANKLGILYIHNRENGKLLKFSEPMIPQKLWTTTNLISNQKDSPIPDGQSGVSWSPMAFNPNLDLAYALNRVKNPNLFDKNGNHIYSGSLVAINVKTGKIEWKFNTNNPMTGGVLSTEGGLVFFGDGDGSIYALNAKTGAKLWQYKCDAGANGIPISYEVQGKQYITIGCGGNYLWSFKRGNKFYSFSL
jgi:alcohol dehydrogenase (cytochrome c)